MNRETMSEKMTELIMNGMKNGIELSQICRKIIDRIEIDRDTLCSVILDFKKYDIVKDEPLYKKIIEVCPIKIKETR